MRVYVNDQVDKNKRVLVGASSIKENKSTIWVRLPDGNVVKRNKKRDLPGATACGGGTSSAQGGN